MKVAIIQPNYIPWRGYFDLIDDVDLFIVYDTVQYTKRDYRNRNRIKTVDGVRWLTVPVAVKGKYQQIIKDVHIDYKRNWIKQHINALRSAYSKAPYFKDYAGSIFGILEKKFATLADLNVHLIRHLMELLGITTQTRLASEFCVSGTKTERLIQILKSVGATSYLSGPSAKSYIEPQRFRDAGIELEYKAYAYKEYPQLYGAFVPNVSVLDLIFNCGNDSRTYLKSLSPNEKVFYVEQKNVYYYRPRLPK